MFQSIQNNFGAGTIQFKDVRENNYLILNATFTYHTDSPEYQAADVLEITVPDLNIDRSTISAVVMRFIDRRQGMSSLIISDGGTVLKSWVKDKNTLCIEKLTAFDDHAEMIIYIQTIYIQLNQGGNAIKGYKRNLLCEQVDPYLNWGSHNFCVVHPKFVFVNLFLDSWESVCNDSDWHCTFENFPLDVDADIPIISARNYFNEKAGGINISHIKERVWKFLLDERNYGFDNTGNYIFGMAYLIRDREIEPDVPGRLRIVENRLASNDPYVNFYELDFELYAKLGMMSLMGRVTFSRGVNVKFYLPNVPDQMPSFQAFVIGRCAKGSGMTVQICTISYNASESRPGFNFSLLAGGDTVCMKISDTSSLFAL